MKVVGTLSIVTYIEIMYVHLSICVDVMLGHLGALVGTKVDPLLLSDMGSIFDVLLVSINNIILTLAFFIFL